MLRPAQGGSQPSRGAGSPGPVGAVLSDGWVDAQFSPLPLELLVCGILPRHGSKDTPLKAWSWREHLPFPGRGLRGGQVLILPRRHQTPPAALDPAGLSPTDVAQHGPTALLVIRASEAQPSRGQPPTTTISHPESHNQPLCPSVLWSPTRQRPWNPGGSSPCRGVQGQVAGARPLLACRFAMRTMASRGHHRPSPRVGLVWARRRPGTPCTPLTPAFRAPSPCIGPTLAGCLPRPAGPTPSLGPLPWRGAHPPSLVSSFDLDPVTHAPSLLEVWQTCSPPLPSGLPDLGAGRATALQWAHSRSSQECPLGPLARVWRGEQPQGNVPSPAWPLPASAQQFFQTCNPRGAPEPTATPAHFQDTDTGLLGG